MDSGQAKRTIDQINSYLQKQLWFDFEVLQYQPGRLVVAGSIDTTVHHNVEIWFKGIAFVSLPMEWKTDTSSPPLSLLAGEAAVRINMRFQVEQGHHIFRFSPEDYPAEFGCLIGARELGFEIVS
ncbi:hypothetical protein OV203_42810 [Nannocystis sp. ILAH1]|uniref:hypothetical protein n=1 Tax=unclassified Nannocystis TaxID=2627009 RepID=UPI002270645E|nr:MULTISPECIES: hypothetical protein [unclassified Nannocystis]MCY0993947.1 hypothetical protein [Nannocystis sp. ILAH1]MCY1066912.1 hypothetical protein [Nannocystis sp. RBIL2]